MANDKDEDDVEVGQEEGMEVDLPDETEEGKGEEGRKGKVEKKDSQTLTEQNEEQQELDDAHTDEDREAIRARRREERKHRKEVGRERSQAKDRLVASLQMQVQDLADRLSRVDQKQSGTDFARLEEDLNQAISTANEAREHLKNSAEAHDGAGVAEATELYYTARRRAEYLSGIKQRVTKQGQQQAPQLDQRVADNASKWIKENSWYNHSGEDTDSAITKVIDNQLAREGFDARTKEYWDELTDRLKEKLPHRFGKTSAAKVNGHSPVSGSDKNSASGSGGSGSSSGKFFLSAERVKAIREAGVWDDIPARNKLIASYRTWDKEHKEQK